MSDYIKLKSDTYDNGLRLTVEDQYMLAATLAANCGYQLVAEDTERSLEIKKLAAKIEKGYGGLPPCHRNLIIQGLEALLK